MAENEQGEQFDDETEDDGFDDASGVDSGVTIEVNGLSVYTHHGVSDPEQEVGQRMVFDLTFDLDECDALLTDRLDDTVDYAKVCELVWLTAQDRSYRTLERLCSVICDRLIEQFDASTVTVRATKPEPPIPLAVGDVSVEVWKERP